MATDVAVFCGTLADNIRYKRPTATTAEVLAAAHAAGLSRLLERLPEGLEIEIRENGVGLSVGERQRLQIARILADNPRPTTLIIAHRYTMLREADYVYVMKEGQVVEEGAPDQLLAANGWFSQLAQQSGQPEPASAPPEPV